MVYIIVEVYLGAEGYKMVKVCFVYLGNICHSPMAEFVMKNLNTSATIYVESRGTSDWEHRNPIHAGTQEILKNMISSITSKRVHRKSLVQT